MSAFKFFYFMKEHHLSLFYFASSECHMHQYKLLLGKLVMHITEPWFLSWIGPAAILAGRKF